MYYYKVYGLNIASYKKIIELIKIDEKEKVDVFIKTEKIERLKKRNLNEKKWFHYEKKFSIFKIFNNGYFLIENGQSIIIEEELSSENRVIKAFILGLALGILIHQREEIAIHGSSIIIDEKAIIFTGKSGMGKSSLASIFKENGYKVIADDIAAITFNEKEEPFINMAYPEQKLTENFMKIRNYKIENLEFVQEKRGKYLVDIKDYFSYSSKKVKIIFEIVKGDNLEISIEKINNEEKIELILNNIYGIELISKDKIDLIFFKKIEKLASDILVYRIIRPRNKLTIEQEFSNILNILNEKY
ncbi:MAG: hypothetical protein ACRDD2_00505 [Sarcina sp.]